MVMTILWLWRVGGWFSAMCQLTIYRSWVRNRMNFHSLRLCNRSKWAIRAYEAHHQTKVVPVQANPKPHHPVCPQTQRLPPSRVYSTSVCGTRRSIDRGGLARNIIIIILSTPSLIYSMIVFVRILSEELCLIRKALSPTIYLLSILRLIHSSPLSSCSLVVVVCLLNKCFAGVLQRNVGRNLQWRRGGCN